MEQPKKRKDRVTIKDVAKSAGVSIATVSYVLNNTQGHSIGEATRKKVLQFANILGYECNIMARYLATGKSNVVAAIVTDFAPLATPYYLRLITELSRILTRRNYGLRLLDPEDAESGGSGCDAYITFAQTESEFRAFADTKYVPVIAVDSRFDDFLFYRINDDYRSMYEQILSETGAARINFLTFPLPRECLDAAEKVFDGVTVINTLADLVSLDTSVSYATVSKLIFDNAPSAVPIKHISASFALKASAAADAAIKAIDRVLASDEDHDLEV